MLHSFQKIGLLDPNSVRIVTLANAGYVKAGFVSNWWDSLKKVGLQNQAEIYASDANALRILKKRRTPCEIWQDPCLHETGTWSTFGSPEFRQTTLSKLSLVSHLLDQGKPILFVDSDVVFLKNPLPWLTSQNFDTPLVFQSDNRMYKDSEKSLICTGFFLMAPDLKLKQVLDITRPDVENFAHDQELLQSRIVGHRETPFSLLPQSHFPNGSCLSLGRIPKEALIIHFNFLKKNAKLIAMRRFGCWSSSHGLLAYLRALPEDLENHVVRNRIRFGAWRKNLTKNN